MAEHPTVAEPLAASPDPEDRGQLRRRQILDAAAACFVREGFHGASIARVAKAAGMSAGNLYHFFPGKEAMIAALVQRRLDQSLALFAEIEAATDPLEAMLERVAISLEQQTDPEQATLGLEILAEAGRNPAVADIVRTADAAIREHLVGLYHGARAGRGPPGREAAGNLDVEANGREGAHRPPANERPRRDCHAKPAGGVDRDLDLDAKPEAEAEAEVEAKAEEKAEAEAVTEVLVAIFQGLPARVISHPELDKARLIPVLRRTLKSLF